MSLNAKKWQAKCSELQKTLDDAILMKEEFVEKFNHMNQKVNTLYVFNFINIFHFKVIFLKRELDESKSKCEESEIKRKFSDRELHDMNENIALLKFTILEIRLFERFCT